MTCRGIGKNEILRTTFLNLDVLYFECDSNESGYRVLLIRKKDKKLSEEGPLQKAATDFVLAMLTIDKDPQPWPTFHKAEKGEFIGNASATPSTVVISSSTTLAV